MGVMLVREGGGGVLDPRPRTVLSLAALHLAVVESLRVAWVGSTAAVLSFVGDELIGGDIVVVYGRGGWLYRLQLQKWSETDGWYGGEGALADGAAMTIWRCRSTDRRRRWIEDDPALQPTVE